MKYLTDNAEAKFILVWREMLNYSSVLQQIMKHVFHHVGCEIGTWVTQKTNNILLCIRYH